MKLNGWTRSFLAGVMFWLATPLVGFALQFDVFVGYGGAVREVSWFPVTCEIMNDGPAFTGTIEITGTHLGKRQRRQLELELPTNTRKRVMIPVFQGTGGLASWDGRLYDEKGKLRSEQPGVRVREVAWEGVLMGSLSRTFAGMPKFPDLREKNSTLQPTVGRMPVEQFPDNVIAYEGLSALYLNSEQALELNSDQIRALTRWVGIGGHLILAIEQPADILASEWLHPLSPFIPRSVSQVAVGTVFFDWLADGRLETIPSAAAFEARRKVAQASQGGSIGPASVAYPQVPRELSFESEVLPIVSGEQLDGDVLLAVDGVPLMISADRGRGKVTVLTFSPEREPFRSWKGRSWFWAKLNGVPPEWFESTRFNTWGGWSVDGIFGSLIESRQVRKVPVKWLLLLLLVYLVAIGPFDHWFLKRINRQMLTWVTFPAYVVLFSLLIYFIGYRLRSGESEWSEFHIVDVVGGDAQGTLRGRTFASIYSPANRRYPVACQVPGAALRSEYLGATGGGQEVGDATMQHMDSGLAAELFVPVWISQLYVAEWSLVGEVPFRVQATRSGTGYSLQLENRGTRPVESIGVAFGNRFYLLNGCAPGESRTEQLSDQGGEALDRYVSRNARNYRSALDSRRQALGSTVRIDGLERHSMVSSFVSLFGSGGESRTFLSPPGLDLAEGVRDGELAVLAFYKDFSPIPALNRFEVARSSKSSLWRFSVRAEGE